MARKSKQPKSPLQYKEAFYSASISGSLFDLREARAEYSRLRKIASKRLKRLEQAGMTSGKLYKNYRDQFISLPKGMEESDVRKMLADVAYFISRPTSSVSGVKATDQKTLEALHKHGYDFIDETNLQQFGDFMDTFREFETSKAYDSEQAYRVFRDAGEKGIDPPTVAKDFEKYVNELEKRKATKPVSKEDEDAIAETTKQMPAIKAPEQKQTPLEKQQKSTEEKRKALEKRAGWIRTSGRKKR